MSAHTPGPWVIRDAQDYAEIIAPDGSEVAFVGREEDADLIAAAPDLLIGLEWAVDLLDMYDKMLIFLGEPEAKVYAPVHLAGKDKARADIAKSRGLK